MSNIHIPDYKRQLLVQFRNKKPNISESGEYFTFFNLVVEFIFQNSDLDGSIFGILKSEHLGLAYYFITGYISVNLIPNIGTEQFSNFIGHLIEYFNTYPNQYATVAPIVIEIDLNIFNTANLVGDNLIHHYFRDSFIFSLFPFYFSNLSDLIDWHISANILLIYSPVEINLSTIFTDYGSLDKLIKWVEKHRIHQDYCAIFLIRDRDAYTLNPIAENIWHLYISKFIDYWINDIDEVFDYPFLA